MISGHNPPRLSYIGPHSEFDYKSNQIDSYVDILKALLENIKLNMQIDIRITCMDISDFKFSPGFYLDVIDEESKDVSSLIDEITSLIARENLRVFFCLSKEYFLGTQIEGMKKSTTSILLKVSEILDLLGVCGTSILIRIGSAYGNRKETMSSFCERLESLGNGVISKVCVMNDDKPSLFSITDILSGIYYRMGVPICFRILPHQFNNGGLTIREALFLSCSTWRSGEKPIFVYSESQEYDTSGMPVSNKSREYLMNRIPTFGLDLDVIIDSPSREDSCLKYRMDYKSLSPIVINKYNKK
jgi:UV DNA damage repair endonuclease